MPQTILAADIGGTHSRFAIFKNQQDGLHLQCIHWVPTESQGSFQQLIAHVAKSDLAEWLVKCTDVVVAVPGPVCNGVANNLPQVSWSVDRCEIHRCFPHTSIAHVSLINDLSAHALARLTPAMNNAICVQRGDERPSGVLSFIGAGTGLGFCSLIPNGNQRYIVVPSEAGHQSFPFCGNEEKRYEAFLQKAIGKRAIDGNSVVSGRGLALLYEFMTGEKLTPECAANKLTTASAVTQTFARYYGRAARNYALSVLSTGGQYITGGVAARNPFLVDHNAFRAEFSECPAHRELLERIPIYLNVNEDSGIWGAAYHAVAASTPLQ